MIGSVVGFAGLVDELGDFAHRAVHRQVFEPDVDRQPKGQPEQAEENAKKKKCVAVGPAQKFDLRKVGELQVGFATSFLRERRGGGKQREHESGCSKLGEFTAQEPGACQPGMHSRSSIQQSLTGLLLPRRAVPAPFFGSAILGLNHRPICCHSIGKRPPRAAPGLPENQGSST